MQVHLDLFFVAFGLRTAIALEINLVLALRALVVREGVGGGFSCFVILFPRSFPFSPYFRYLYPIKKDDRKARPAQLARGAADLAFFYD